MLINTSPLGTALLAWLFLGEPLTGRKIVGIVTVLAGITLVQRVGSASTDV